MPSCAAACHQASQSVHRDHAPLGTLGPRQEELGPMTMSFPLPVFVYSVGAVYVGRATEWEVELETKVFLWDAPFPMESPSALTGHGKAGFRVTP